MLERFHRLQEVMLYILSDYRASVDRVHNFSHANLDSR